MATANNRVEVDLDIGRDSLTPALNRIQGLANSMRGQNFGGGFSNVVGGAVEGIAQSVASAAMQAISQITQSVGRAITESARQQTMTIASASDVALGLKMDLEPSIQLIEDTQIQLSKIAAAMPGEVSDFNAIFRQVASAVAPLSSNPLDFQQKALDSSKRAGVLSAISGADPERSGSVLDRFISGSSGWGEIALNDIIQKNSVFKAALEKGIIAKAGSTKNLKDLSNRDRFEILQNALKVATPDALINRFKGTAESAIADMKSKLFDPQTGLFGFLRKLPKMGGRTALDGVASFLQSVNNLGDMIGSMVGIDPMEIFVKITDFFSDMINQFGAALDPANGGLSISKLTGFFVDLFSIIPDLIINFITTADFGKIGLAIGSFAVAMVAAWVTVIPKIVATFFAAIGAFAYTLAVAIFVAPLKFLYEMIVSFFSWIFDPIKKPIEDFFKGIKEFFDKALGWIPGSPGSNNANGNPLASVQGAAGIANEGLKIINPFYGVTSAVGDLVNKAKGDPQKQSFLPDSQGQPLAIPSAQPVASNGSTPPFVANLSITGSAQDANEIASVLMDQLSQAYGQFKQGALT